MAILKSEIRNKYTTIPNSIIQENELSDGDFRLLIFLYSLPDKWKINQSYLANKMNCSRVNLNKKIRRIKDAGYLEIIKSNNKSTDYIYVLKEKPVSLKDVSLSDVSLKDVSPSDTYINNNIINNEIINNELINTTSTTTYLNNNLYSYVEEAFGRTLNSIEYEIISTWEDNELTRYAVKQAVLNGAYRIKYIEGILANYKRDNIKSVVEAQEKEKKFQESKNTGNKSYKTKWEAQKEAEERFLSKDD